MQTLRFASENVAARYPLAISGPAVWSRGDCGWSTMIPLPKLPNDHIVVPSFAQLDAPGTNFSVELGAVNSAWTLSPTSRDASAGAAADPRATTHIAHYEHPRRSSVGGRAAMKTPEFFTSAWT